MDYKDIIESGLLELYALGALDEKESKELALKIEESEELKQEYESIVEALKVYGEAYSGDAPNSVLEKAKADITALKSDEQDTNEIEQKKGSVRKLSTYRFIAIAASLLLFTSVGLNLKLNGDLNTAKSKYLALEEEKAVLAGVRVNLEDSTKRLQDFIASVSAGEVQSTFMGSTENYPGYQGMVYWNKTSSEVRLGLKNLPELQENEQYQLWAIVDGVPVDAGLFTQNDTLVEMKNISGNVAAFAVTIEPKGGSENPTLEKMCMLGNVTPAAG